MTRHFNQLTEAQAERLALLSEECAEVIQVVSKILRHGYESVNPLVAVPEGELPWTNRMLLEKELGHVLCAQRLLRKSADIRNSEIARHDEEKAEKIHRWLHHQQEARNA